MRNDNCIFGVRHAAKAFLSEPRDASPYLFRPTICGNFTSWFQAGGEGGVIEVLGCQYPGVEEKDRASQS